MLYCKGHRVRAGDCYLSYRFVWFAFSIIMISTVLLFHFQEIQRVNISTLNLSTLTFHFSVKDGLSILTGIVCCGLAIFLYLHYAWNHWRSLVHRQKIARMILENHWYEVAIHQQTSFFKDLNATQAKEKIVRFPKIYYRQKNGLIYILVEITLGQYQDQLLKLEKKLESGLYCELIEKELKDSYVEYTLLYDTLANRISIEGVVAENGSLRLMKNKVWAYDSLPHMLIAGGTGSGKSYFILTIIEALLKTNAKIFVIDPKNADLADLDTVIPHVYTQKEEITACVEDFHARMVQRSQEMKHFPEYKTGENYSYLGLSPNFLVFDEYVAFMEMLVPKESTVILSKLKQIVMLGRQAGFFLILACQRPDAKYLGDGIRDQFNFRVALGRMSELGYSMMYGEVNKDFFLKQIKGHGYLDAGTGVITEFYTPLVPKGHDFLKEISQLFQQKKITEKSK